MLIDKYDSEKFKKYLKGEMSHEEAHAFEKEVLKDPFAQDAMEGLEAHSPHEVIQDLKKLRIKTKTVQKSRFSWIQIAAAISLLLVSSMAVWLVVDPLSKEEVLAMESQTVEEKNEDQVEDTEDFFKADSVHEKSAITEQKRLEEKEVITGEEVPKTEPTQVAQVIDSSDAEKGLSNDQLAEVIVEEALDESVANAQGAASFADEDLTVAFQADDEDEAIKEEPIELDAKVVASELSTAPSVSPALAPEEKAKKTEATVLKDQGDEIAEESRVASARSRSASGQQVLKPTDVRTEATPESGLNEFQKYIRENLRYPQAAMDNGIKGIVILELTISSSGDISNIDVKKSLGYGCDTEAIRLVYEGPKWNPAVRNGVNEEDKVRVRVRFRN